MRIDAFLFENGYFESREKAKKAIAEGRISYKGRTVTKPSSEIGDASELQILPSEFTEYVGRGGRKLEKALDDFAVSAEGMCVADIGASTGGFTDCILRRGAARVFAIDIGHGQLHPSLRSDPRVVNIEGVNARNVTTDHTGGEPVDIAVCDLSFISQTLVIPAVTGILKSGGSFITLVKPQFEVGRDNIAKNGIVKSEKARLDAVARVIACSEENGFLHKGTIESPIKGGSGNTEYLAYFTKP